MSRQPSNPRDAGRVMIRAFELAREEAMRELCPPGGFAAELARRESMPMAAAEVEVEARRLADNIGLGHVPEEPASTSDETLGRHRREQLARFAAMGHEQTESREAEWERWRAEGARIQAGRTREASKRKLAELVKASLNLPDSVETIRKKL